MKKILCICSLLFFSFTTISARPSSVVNEKVAKIFKAGFPDVKAPSWHTFENYYEVYFKDDANCCSRIDYGFDGTLISTLLHYPGSKLPAFIKAKLIEKYHDKSIFGVTELTTQTDHVYNIVLQDEKYWYNVESDDAGNLRLASKFKKA
jgi:hypothetical protein